MYYKLLPEFLLRGWNLLPYGIVNTTVGNTYFVDKNDMEVLKMCNGRIDFNLPLFSDVQRDTAEEWEKRGVIVRCESGESIRPDQKYLYYDNRYIHTAHWSITGRCNYKCRHCFQSAPDAKYGELSHEEIMGIIDDFEKCGVFNVSITGGEPLVRNDFFEIIDALVARHIHIEAIYSNGLLVNEKLLKALKERGLDPEINMSFDGTEGWHDWLRGVKGATEIVDKAFALCRDYGFSTASEMCIFEQNKHTMRDSINHLASLGCKAVKINPVSDFGAWHEGGYGKSIDYKEALEKYLEYIPYYFEDGKPMDVMLGGVFYVEKDSDEYSIPFAKMNCDIDKACVCGHARTVMYISPEGRTLPCFSLSSMDIQKDYPSIVEKGLKYCLTDSTYMSLIETKVRKVIEHNERCRNCEFKERCRGGCRAGALETSSMDIFGIDESTCILFMGGYEERIKEIISRAAPEMKYTYCR